MVHRPTTLASAVAVLVAAGSVLLVAGWTHALPVGLTVFGLLVLGFGVHRDDATATLLVGLCGIGIALTGVAFVATANLDNIATAELYPGLIGVAVLTGALLPIRRGWETALATAGAALLFVSVLNSGIAYGSDRLVLLVATAGVVASWDAARHAITLGAQVGRQAETRGVELTHVGATLLVGAVFVALTELVWRLGVTDLPLEALVVFLGAALAFLVVLYR
jgi:hypothetical protein